MPCGKRPLVKSWDKSRYIRVVKPSRYQQNEDSVKIHWRNVIKELELSYKDEHFWETHAEIVRGLVSEITFERIAKIFNLPVDRSKYEPQSEVESVVPSEQFYTAREAAASALHRTFSIASYEPSVEEEEAGEEESDLWSESSMSQDMARSSRSRTITPKASGTMSKSFSKVLSKSFSKFLSKSQKSMSKFASKTKTATETTADESARSSDDLFVHPTSKKKITHPKRVHNPHFEMLYCNESETDMIKWNSKYKKKTFQVSASDEFSKKAELLTKQIAHEFYEWWVGLGNVEFKSEIKRPEDIEDLFQVWFDEHASRGLVLDPKILPCVLQSIAEAVRVPKAACPKVLKRQIASDIHAETSPAHTMAFGKCLPVKMKHIPPQNNTKEMWHYVKIPEDLRSMACVWEDISHLTSTKAFKKWLEQRTYLPMPPCLKDRDGPREKALFVVPSDYVVRDKSMDMFSAQDLALPVSQFSLEIKEVLSRLLNE